MCASRIFCLARTSRCARVGSGTRKARAISAVVRPQRVRRVNATWASLPSDGWQQVKISRSLSSGYSTASSNSAGSSKGCSRCASYSSSGCFSVFVFSRRTASKSFRWATVVSQAPGFRGTPSFSQCTAAEANASCNDSSARSKEPERRINVAMIRPYSSRKTSSSVSPADMAARVAQSASAGKWNLCGAPANRLSSGIQSPTSSVLFSTKHLRQSFRLKPERANLDAAFAAQAGGGNLLGPLDRLCQILAVEDVIACQLLLCLGERSVHHQHLAVPAPDCGGRAGWAQRRRALQDPELRRFVHHPAMHFRDHLVLFRR